MDSNLTAAIVTSVCTAGGTAGVAITALLLSNKLIDRLDKRIDRLEVALDKINATLEMLTGSLHDIDKRLSVLEDRILNRPQ